MTNQPQILLASRPAGDPRAANFRLVEPPVPELATARCWCATIT